MAERSLDVATAAGKDHTEVIVADDFTVPRSLIKPASEAPSSYSTAPPAGYPTQIATKPMPPAGYPVSNALTSNVSYHIPITATAPPASTFSSYYTPTASVLDVSHHIPVCYPPSSYPPVPAPGYSYPAPYDPTVGGLYPPPAAGLTPSYPPSTTTYPPFGADSASNSAASYGLVPSYPSSHYNCSPFQAVYPPRSLE